MPKLLGGSEDRKELPGQSTLRGGRQTIGSHAKVDIEFVFDTTGSMTNKIDALLEKCREFTTVPKQYHLDPAFSLIAFGDLTIPGDKIEWVVPLTEDIAKIQQGLTDIPRYSGGGNEGESSFEAIKLSLSGANRSGAVKVMILITDEPALQHNISPSHIEQLLANHEVLFYALTPNREYFKSFALKNGGEWKEIGTSSDLGMLMSLFEKLAHDVSHTVNNVMKLADGSVKKFKTLPPGK